MLESFKSRVLLGKLGSELGRLYDGLKADGTWNEQAKQYVAENARHIVDAMLQSGLSFEEAGTIVLAALKLARTHGAQEVLARLKPD